MGSYGNLDIEAIGAGGEGCRVKALPEYDMFLRPRYSRFQHSWPCGVSVSCLGPVARILKVLKYRSGAPS